MIELFGNFIPRFPDKDLRAKSISRTGGAPVRESENEVETAKQYGSSRLRYNRVVPDFGWSDNCQKL
jgi:hypothetical protein